MLHKAIESMAEEFQFQKNYYKMTKDTWKRVSACVFGTEFRFRPRELFCRDISPYFPKGRKQCYRYLRSALEDFVYDKAYKRFYLIGKGPLAKMAANVLGDLQKTNPELQVDIWFFGITMSYIPERWKKRFQRACRCTFGFFHGPVWLAEYNLMLRSDMALHFDVTPGRELFYEKFSRSAGCPCINLASQEERKKYARDWED